MTSELTNKLIRVHFEIWSAYQLMYYRTATDSTFYDKLFNNNYWNGVRPTFKDVESFANLYWDYKNIIRIAKTDEELKFIIDKLEQILGTYPQFLDTLYLCTSELFRMKYDSLQDAIQEVIDIYHDEEPEPEPEPDPDPEPEPDPEEPIEELEVRVLKTIYALSGAINHGILNNYAHSLGNTGSVVIVKPYSQLSLTPGDIQPSPYIQPARMYAGTMNRLEVIIAQNLE